MSLLYRLTLVLIVCFALSMIAARVLGSGGKVALASIFTDPNGASCERPCLFGVQPGVTRIEDAVAMLRTHPLTQQFVLASETPFLMGDPATGTFITFVTTSDGLVDAVGVSPGLYTRGTYSLLPVSASFGDAVLVFGAPKRVTFANGIYRLIFGTDGVTVTGSLSAGRFDISSPLNGLVLTNIAASDCSRASISPTLATWIGFTTYDRYRKAGTSSIVLVSNNGGGLDFRPCQR